MEKINCPACKNELLEKIDYCTKCKFPFKGDETEKAIHIGRFIDKKGVIMDSESSIEKSQIILYAITLLNFSVLILNIIFNGLIFLDLAINIILTLSFLYCAVNIRKNPIRLTVIPLTILIVIYGLNFLIDPMTLARGLFLKIIIIGSMIYSIYLIKSAERFKKEYNIKD